MLATQHATSVLTVNRLAALVLGLFLSACTAAVLAKSAAAQAQDQAAANSRAKTADPEQYVAVFTGMYENGVPVYRGLAPITVIVSRKVELAKIAREREMLIRAQAAHALDREIEIKIKRASNKVPS
jgi:hypothetical protein